MGIEDCVKRPSVAMGEHDGGCNRRTRRQRRGNENKVFRTTSNFEELDLEYCVGHTVRSAVCKIDGESKAFFSPQEAYNISTNVSDPSFHPPRAWFHRPEGSGVARNVR